VRATVYRKVVWTGALIVAAATIACVVKWLSVDAGHEPIRPPNARNSTAMQIFNQRPHGARNVGRASRRCALLETSRLRPAVRINSTKSSFSASTKARPMTTYQAALLGVDESTTKTGIGVRSGDGRQRFESIENRGVVKWNGEKAFDLAALPGMVLETLDQLAAKGWRFNQPGALSFSVRQHDMALVDADDRLLMPALTWQCNAAIRQVARLQELGVEKIVGKIEERFILPKLLWALEKEPSLRERIHRVATTGDYMARMLGGEFRLSASDALSNGLLVQSTKELASEAFQLAGLNPDWFPSVAASGTVIGTVAPTPGGNVAWNKVAERLNGWKIVSGLGDNHATGVGCGGLVDRETIVVSAGTSGTVNRRVDPSARLAGKAACFEFYDDRLLLLMLHDCAAWYERFYDQFAQAYSFEELNEAALSADLSNLPQVEHDASVKRPELREVYSDDWEARTIGEQTAATQLAIMARLIDLAREMIAESPDGPKVKRMVLTGGMSQSILFQQAFRAGVEAIAPGVEALRGASTDELSYQTAAYGALINALLPERGGDLGAICRELCPLKPCAAADGEKAKRMAAILSDWA
jgi:sugar (pentulose or hexulose) kinase